MSPSSNTRWCPTPEQLMILEELYRKGLKTPNATQIQRITAHLSFHGKIQGKNVFYWFQNHKARDRQKLRKKLAKQMHQHQLLQQQLYHYKFEPVMTHRYAHAALDFHHTNWNNIQQLPNYCYSPPENLHAQQGSSSGVCEEEAPEEGLMKQMIGSYGHDFTMIMDVGPKNKTLQTLDLFPLRSSTTDNQKSTFT